MKLEIVESIVKFNSLSDGTFSFLNLSSSFHSWNDISNGMLWAYNLNYMDWLLQRDMEVEKGIEWIDRFISDLPQNKVGLDPYPISLRGINWIKFITLHYDKIEEQKKQIWNNSLYSQYVLLTKKLEYHLLGNHLLENAYSLFIAAIYFKDKNFYKKSVKLLRKELDEQILPDGAHYEQSPMYHCILLDRLLDCYNFSSSNIRFENQSEINEMFEAKSTRMLGHLESIVYADDSIPLVNDAANGIAPTPSLLFDYAKRMGLQWGTIKMKNCGYRKLKNETFESIIDAGNITASYQPGHSHADTFTYELRINGKSFIVDSGISTYNNTTRRQLERSTKAHNAVTVDGKNSSDVWGGFRIGRRAKVKIPTDMEDHITAIHNGFGKTGTHRRTFQITRETFEITDTISTPKNAISYIHFAPDTKILSYNKNEIKTDTANIKIEGAIRMEIIDGKISTEYNTFHLSKVVAIHFLKTSKYIISDK
jgi:hypothetical protein